MGRLLKIAMAFIEEQWHHTNPAKTTCDLTGKNNEAVLPCKSVAGYDIDDNNDQGLHGPEVRPTLKQTRFLFNQEDLEQFARSGKINRIYLEAIDDTILMVPDNAPLAEGLFSSGLMTYDVSEWEALYGVTPEHFRSLHEIKKLFGGKIKP
jgi:hypothetical protein